MRFISFIDKQGAAAWGVRAGEGVVESQRLGAAMSTTLPATLPATLQGLIEACNADPALLAQMAAAAAAQAATPLRVPRISSALDFEAELAVVIGLRARFVAEADALQHVFAYACFNDASLRDYQRKTTQWTIGKNFDATGGFGPSLVTADELPPGCLGLHIESRLNGQVMQSASTSDMVFGVARTLSLLSEALTLEPGDVVVMGTPAGVGYARTPPVWMEAGDTIEVEIEGVGLLSNPVL